MYARMSVHSHGMEDSERSSVDASKNNILATDVQKKIQLFMVHFSVETE